MWYNYMQKYPNSQNSQVWKIMCARPFFFSASVQELGMRLPVNTIWSCACSDAMHLLSPAPQNCSLHYSILCVVCIFIACFVHSMINMMPQITGSRVLIKHCIAANLVDINLVISAKTPYFLIWWVLNLVIWDFNSQMWRHCYNVSQADQVPVACVFKLREGLAWAVSLARLPIFALSRVYCCTLRWGRACRAVVCFPMIAPW